MATIVVQLKPSTAGKFHSLICRRWQLCCNCGVPVPEALCCTQAASVSVPLYNAAIKSSLCFYSLHAQPESSQNSYSQRGLIPGTPRTKVSWVVLIIKSHLPSQPLASHCLQNTGFASKHLLVWGLHCSNCSTWSTWKNQQVGRGTQSQVLCTRR